MKIKLQTGNVITVIADESIGRGDRVLVFYDFTRNRVQDICLFGQIVEPEPDEPEEDEPFEPSEGDEDLEEGAFSLPGWDLEEGGAECPDEPNGSNETIFTEKEESLWEIGAEQSHIWWE